MATETYLVKKIQIMQDESESLKKMILKTSSKKPVKIRGIWKGVHFTEAEIEKEKVR